MVIIVSSHNYVSDRFIPCRLSPYAADYYAMQPASTASVSCAQSVYAQRVLEACTGQPFLPTCVLPYTPQIDTVPRLDQQYRQALLQAEREQKILARATPRNITLVKLYDTPDYVPDFYKSLLDVQTQNVLGCSSDIFAIGLSEKAYLMNVQLHSIHEIKDASESNSYYSLVQFLKGENRALVAREDSSYSLVDAFRSMSISSDKLALGTFESADSLNHTMVCAGTSKGEVKLMDFRARHNHTLGHHSTPEHVCGVSIHSDQVRVATGGNDNHIFVWDTRYPNRPLNDVQIHNAAVRALSWAPLDRELLLSGGGTADARICVTSFEDPAAPKVVAEASFKKSQVTTIAVLEGKREVVTGHGYGGEACSVWSYDRANITPITSFCERKERILDVVVSGERCYTLCADETLGVWQGVFGPTSAEAKEESGLRFSMQSRLR